LLLLLLLLLEMNEVLRAERKVELAAVVPQSLTPARVLLVEGQPVHGARQGLRARTTDKSAA